MSDVATGTKFNGVTLKTAPTFKARRREAPFLIRALTATSREQSQTAINEGRAFIERSREVALETGRKRK
jgi:hypothetical protein